MDVQLVIEIKQEYIREHGCLPSSKNIAKLFSYAKYYVLRKFGPNSDILLHINTIHANILLAKPFAPKIVSSDDDSKCAEYNNNGNSVSKNTIGNNKSNNNDVVDLNSLKITSQKQKQKQKPNTTTKSQSKRTKTKAKNNNNRRKSKSQGKLSNKNKNKNNNKNVSANVNFFRLNVPLMGVRRNNGRTELMYPTRIANENQIILCLPLNCCAIMHRFLHIFEIAKLIAVNSYFYHLLNSEIYDYLWQRFCNKFGFSKFTEQTINWNGLTWKQRFDRGYLRRMQFPSFVRNRLTQLGIDTDEYLNETLDDLYITSFEYIWKCKLPSDYKLYLTQVGNGGIGPLHGIPKLESSANQDLRYTRLFAPFPYKHTVTDNKSIYQRVNGMEEYIKDGTVCIAQNIGTLTRRKSGFEHFLVITGKTKGMIWIDSMHANKGLICTQKSFLTWFEDWLESPALKCKVCADETYFGCVINNVDNNTNTKNSNRGNTANANVDANNRSRAGSNQSTN